MKSYRFWSEQELEELEKFCKGQEFNSRTDAARKFKETHPGRSLHAIRLKLLEHPEWIRIRIRTADAPAYSEEEKPSEKPRLLEDHFGVSPEDLESKVPFLLEILKQGPTTISAISEDPRINIPKEAVWPLIDILRSRGYDIVEEKRKVWWRRFWKTIDRSFPPLTKRNKIEILFTEGPCFGLKTQQGDLLATCLAIGEQRGVWCNIMLGNLVAGLPSRTRIPEFFLFTIDDQAEYVISRFPKASFNTFLLNGKRELSFRKVSKGGGYIESLICPAREDIRFLGDEKAIIPIGRNDAKVAIVSHEAQGYTKSYPLQGIAENFQEAYTYMFEHSEPFRGLIVGGLHTGILIPRAFPPHPDRYNDFDKVAIPTLHRLPLQSVSRRRGASPELGCLVLGAKWNEEGEFTGFTYAFYPLTAYFKKDDYLEDVPANECLSADARKVFERLRRGPARAGELSRTIGRAIKKSGSNRDLGQDESSKNDKVLSVEEAIEELRKAGYEIVFNDVRRAYELSGRQLKKKFKPIPLSILFKKKSRFLLTSDWHIGHKGERPDLIREVYRIAEENTVEAIVHSGNLFEGVSSYRGQHRDLIAHEIDEQRKRLLEIIPKSPIPLIVIASPLHEHDRAPYAYSGHDVVETFSEIAQLKGYPVVYLGGPHGAFEWKGVKYDVFHPRGGMPYGKTYRLQRIIEELVEHMLSLAEGERATFVGHLHIATFMLFKGIAGFHVPALKDAPEDEYIRSLGKMGQLGVWVVEFAFDELNNITKVELEYIPFEPLAERFRNTELKTFLEQWNMKWQESSNEEGKEE